MAAVIKYLILQFLLKCLPVSICLQKCGAAHLCVGCSEFVPPLTFDRTSSVRLWDGAKATVHLPISFFSSKDVAQALLHTCSDGASAVE